MRWTGCSPRSTTTSRSSFTWDSVGNLLQDRQGYTAVGSERWQAVNTAYTDAGSMSAIAYPSTFQVSHTRDVDLPHDGDGRRLGPDQHRDLHVAGRLAARHDLQPERDGHGLRLRRLPKRRLDRPHARRAAGASTSSSTPTTRSTIGGWRRTPSTPRGWRRFRRPSRRSWAAATARATSTPTTWPTGSWTRATTSRTR